MSRTVRLRSLALLAGLALAASACSDSPSGNNNEPEPASITKTGGDEQTAAAGAAVTTAPTVRVLDEDGGPVQGVTVTFTVTSGGGTVTGATPTTTATGHASVGSWTLGAAGGANSLTATVEGLTPVVFSATGQIATATPADITLYMGSGQTGQVSAPLPASPTVLVTDENGQPVQNATVSFSVQGGGGSITGGTQATNAQGLARVGEWWLGPNPGVNTLRATVAGLPPVDVSATGAAVNGTAFNVTLRFISIVSPAQYDVFEDARLRWEEVITGELANIVLAAPGQVLCPASYGTPAVSGTIDDVVIFVKLVDIDGPGQVLGSAGPCSIRTSNGLPIAGVMNFDLADLAQMQTNGTLRDVILHEMGHVLGIGSLWNITNPSRTLLTDAGTAEPYFNGTGAITAFDAAGGTAYALPKVPVENTGGTGTRDSHWRETVLGNELMTGFISSVANPLSGITVASLDDMGYEVNAAAADGYAWSSAVRLNAGEVTQQLVEEPMDGPITILDDRGRVTGSLSRP